MSDDDFPEPTSWNGADMRPWPSSDGRPERYACLHCAWRGRGMRARVDHVFATGHQVVSAKDRRITEYEGLTRKPRNVSYQTEGQRRSAEYYRQLWKTKTGYSRLGSTWPTLDEIREVVSALADWPTVRGWHLGLGVVYAGLGNFRRDEDAGTTMRRHFRRPPKYHIAER